MNTQSFSGLPNHELLESVRWKQKLPSRISRWKHLFIISWDAGVCSDELLICKRKIMIFILLPLLTSALNVTGHDRTDVKGRYWEETYECYDKHWSGWDWEVDASNDEEERYCNALSEWQVECLSDKGLEIDWDSNAIWEDEIGHTCGDYLYYSWCTEDGK